MVLLSTLFGFRAMIVKLVNVFSVVSLFCFAKVKHDQGSLNS